MTDTFVLNLEKRAMVIRSCKTEIQPKFSPLEWLMFCTIAGGKSKSLFTMANDLNASYGYARSMLRRLEQRGLVEVRQNARGLVMTPLAKPVLNE